MASTRSSRSSQRRMPRLRAWRGLDLVQEAQVAEGCLRCTLRRDRKWMITGTRGRQGAEKQGRVGKNQRHQYIRRRFCR